MSLISVEAGNFPHAVGVLEEQVGRGALVGNRGSVVIFGGAARAALLEYTDSQIVPIRDVDVAAVGEEYLGKDLVDIHMSFHPDEGYDDVEKIHFPDAETLIAENTDVTLNESVILLGEKPELKTTVDAIDAVDSRMIIPTPGRIAKAKELEAGGEDTHRAFLRMRTQTPARTAYFIAVFEAAGVEFHYDMLDHPMPPAPEDSHLFFLGLQVRRAIEVDHYNRGPWDITATTTLFEIFEEMKLVENLSIKTVADVARYCEMVNENHRQLKFDEDGTAIGTIIKHSDKPPEPKVP